MNKTEFNLFQERENNKYILTFGKHAGKQIDDLLKTEGDYLRWYSQSSYCRPEQKEYILSKLDEPVITFGKYAGKTYRELKELNPKYMDWLSNTATNIYVKAAIKSVN